MSEELTIALWFHEGLNDEIASVKAWGKHGPYIKHYHSDGRAVTLEEMKRAIAQSKQKGDQPK